MRQLDYVTTVSQVISAVFGHFWLFSGIRDNFKLLLLYSSFYHRFTYLMQLEEIALKIVRRWTKPDYIVFYVMITSHRTEYNTLLV